MASSLLADINRTDLSPASIVASGSTAFFLTRDASGNTDLWRSDGTAAGTTQALSVPPASISGPDAADSLSIRDLTAWNGGVYFFVPAASKHGYDLHRVDATSGANTLVQSFATDGTVYPDQPDAILPMGNVLNFTMFSPNYNLTIRNSLKLYRSDGTAAGTSLLGNFPDTDLTTEPSLSASQTTTLGSNVLFFAKDANGSTLYMTDETVAGTAAIASYNAGFTLDGFTSLGTTAIYFGLSTYVGKNLFATDGATATTIAPGLGLNIRPVVYQGKAYFGATGTNGREALYVSDGTAAGTTAVAEFSNLNDLVSTPAGLRFTADDGQGGTLLYASDGTAAGTTAVAGVALRSDRVTVTANSSGDPNVLVTAPSRLVAIGSEVFFASFDPTRGMELWASDGTAAGTHAVGDLNPGAAGSDPIDLTPVASRLYFAAHDGTTRNALWVADGAGAAASLVKGFGTDLTASSMTEGFAALPDLASITHATVGGRVVFLADDGEHGLEPWVTDGTAAGTRILADIRPGPEGSGGTEFFVNGASLYFKADDGVHGRELWVTDGTPEGTHLVLDIQPGAASAFPLDPTHRSNIPVYSGLAALGGEVYFLANDGSTAQPQLWKTDGTAAGTTLVTAIAVDFAGSTSIVAAGGKAYFAFYGFTSDRQVFETDGTAAGTVPATGVLPSPAQGLTAVGSRLYFTTLDGSGETIWVTDGTPRTESQVINFAHSQVSHLEAIGDRLLFTNDGGTGQQLWSTDGTVAGTSQIDSIATPTNQAAIVGDTGFFIDSPKGGLYPLYRTDGTAAGTYAIPGPAAGTIGPTPLGGSVYYVSGSALGHGLIVYTDGNPTAATFATDLAIGFSNGTPVVPVLIRPDSHMIAFSDDGTHGAELIDIAPPSPSAPKLTAAGPLSVDEGSTLTFQAQLTNPGGGRVLTYSLAPGAPAGAAIDPATGKFTYSPSVGPSDVAATIRVVDAALPGAFDMQTLAIHVNDVAPVVAAPAALSTVQGQQLSTPVSFTDPGAETWTATIDYGDGGGPVPVALTGAKQFLFDHAYAAAGHFTATLAVTDSGGLAGTAKVDVSVAAMPRPGVIAFDAATAQVSERAGVVVLTVTRAGGSDGTVSARYATADGSATAGSDYTAGSGLVTFGPGETSRTISIPIRDAGLFSGQKTFSVALDTPAGGAGLGALTSAKVVIQEDDPLPPPAQILGITPVSSKKKGVTAFQVKLNGAIDGASINGAGIFSLSRSIKKGKKTIQQALPIASARYDSSTRTITLALAKKLAIKGAAKLKVVGDSIRDAYGQALDGDKDGKAGGTALFSVARSGAVSALGLHVSAVDAVLSQSASMVTPSREDRPLTGRR